MEASKNRRCCWCGNRDLKPFATDYRLCRACGTLVSLAELSNEGYLVQNDETDFYGKQYWLDHQAAELGLPQIEQRARLDLPERCVHWIRHLLLHRLPPARVLELGSAHGGFVALMRAAGYDATGLEMSPWVADLARRTFNVPMLVGPIEAQGLEPGSFDVIVAHDVMEHLPDPLTTLKHAVRLLKPDGILAIQMPEYPDGKSFAELETAKDRFLLHLHKDEHLYLYSKRAARQLYQQLGLEHFQFHEPMFDYDMYFFASRLPLVQHPPEAIANYLQTSPPGRLLLALLDKSEELRHMQKLWQESEQDRAARLVVINNLTARLQASDADRAARLQVINELSRQLTISNADRAARLKAVTELESRLINLQRDYTVCDQQRSQRQEGIKELERLLARSEAERLAQQSAIAELSRDLMVADNDRNARLRVILHQEQILDEHQAMIGAQQRALEFLHDTCLTPAPPPLWKWLPKKLARLLLPRSWRRTLRARLSVHRAARGDVEQRPPLRPAA